VRERKMEINFEKFVGFETDKTITLEEENEISDLVKQVLTRKDERRKVRLVMGIDIIGKDV
jgi:uncharacterized HAD superfamily protein